MKLVSTENSGRAGFALVVTLSLMILLTAIALGILSLSAISLRSNGIGMARAEAQANARLALMLAIGELQKEMGPDMRVSAESALFDGNPDTAAMDGVAQSHWLASYNSWGDWLNNDYSLPDGGGTLKIQDTYAPRRERMFRRWLLTLPQGMATDPKAPLSISNLNDPDWVALVGNGSLGPAAQSHPDQVTRAYLTSVGTRGKQAWWISPENQKAEIDLAKRPRTLSAEQWEVAQGDTAEVGVGALPGFDKLDSNPELSKRLISYQTLVPAQIDDTKVKENFYDLTALSAGVITSVRTGQLKKDLSLLFEKSTMPDPYQFKAGSIREPSIRPMSPELAANLPVIPNRQFASWTNMRHYYRMYHGGSTATIGNTGGAGSLNWNGSKPWTDLVSTTAIGGSSTAWNGSNSYWRAPVLAKVTFIYSLVSEPSATPGKYDCYQVYSPVFTFWNPYNVELHIPDKIISMFTSAYKIMPNAGQFWLGNSIHKDTSALGLSINVQSFLRSGTGGEIIFKPGEFRIFSHKGTSTSGGNADLMPGFDPQSIGGEKLKYGTYSPSENPGLTIEFSH